MSLVYRCDKCKTIIEKGKHFAEVEIQEYVELGKLNDYNTYHLCPKCVKELKKWMDKDND